MNKYIYKISLVDTDFFYIGIHLGNDEDDYMGSSTYFHALRYCYPNINFKKEILYVFPDDVYDITEYKLFENELLNQINFQDEIQPKWTIKDMKKYVREDAKRYNAFASIQDRYWELIAKYISEDIRVFDCKRIELDFIRRNCNDLNCINVAPFEKSVLQLANLNSEESLLIKKLYVIYAFPKLKELIRVSCISNSEKKDQFTVYIHMYNIRENIKMIFDCFMSDDFKPFLMKIESLKNVLY